MRLLLDTTVLIDMLRRREGRLEWVRQLVDAGHELTTSAINVAEVYGGMRGGESTATESLLDALEVHPVTDTIARHGGSLQYAWARKGVTLALPDALIAATALEHGLALATGNAKDFPMPELKLYPLA